MRRLWIVALILVAMLATACGGTTESGSAATVEQSPATEAPAASSGEAQTISVAGSTTVQPLAEKFAEAYSARFPNVKIDVQGGGSSTGVKSAGGGTVDIGAASREIEDSELQEYPDLKVFVIAYDGIAITVNPDVPVDGLTLDQVRDIFAGDITNWKAVGGPDKPIIVVSREEGSGTREVINDYLGHQAECTLGLKVAMELGSPEAVKGAVEAGMGVSVVSRATIQKELRLGTLVAINLDPPLDRPFSFVHQKQKFRLRVMEELLEFARAYCRARGEH